MKQRIILSILMLWSFLHFILFAFNGFGINNESSSDNFIWPIDMENWIGDIEYYGFLKSNFFDNLQLFDYKKYDLTEFLIYVILPIFVLSLFNYIRFNQFKLLVDRSQYPILEKHNKDKMIESNDGSIKITPQPNQTNAIKAIIYLLILISLLLTYIIIKKDEKVVIKRNNPLKRDLFRGW
jgi:hypothetical protein